jgi:hypothetical protein
MPDFITTDEIHDNRGDDACMADVNDRLEVCKFYHFNSVTRDSVCTAIRGYPEYPTVLRRGGGQWNYVRPPSNCPIRKAALDRLMGRVPKEVKEQTHAHPEWEDD